MHGSNLHDILILIQQCVSFLGVLIIISGVIFAISQYFYFLFTAQLLRQDDKTNDIRLRLGRVLVLGLEFIVAADLISTTTAPDYYSIGIVASIVLIRTLLNYSLNKEIASLSK